MGLNIKKIELLPIWCITDKYPAFYDTESATAIEQTAKLYGAMRILQEEYNNMATNVNTTITAFITDVNADQKELEERLTKIIHDYLDYMNMRMDAQDKEIRDAVAYMKENISQSITQIIAEMKEMGELDESILNAIDGIGNRVATLEENTTNMNTRIETIENSKTYLSYNADKKELNLIINERVGD